MLSFSISSRDVALSWKSNGQGWSAGSSFVEPFANSALENIFISSDVSCAFVVRETFASTAKRDPTIVHIGPDEFERQLESFLNWPLNVCAICLHRSCDPPVVIRTGGWGSAPLFLTSPNGALHGHWDAARLYRYTSGTVDLVRAAYTLANLATPYSRRTLFPEMVMLTERAQATWSRGGKLEVHYPEALPWSAASTLVAGADVLGVFEELLTAAIRRWFDPSKDVIACELSGGLDSGTVAIAAAGLSAQPLRTFGLIMPGDTGAQQIPRRNALVEACDARDVVLNALDNAPFTRGERDADDAMVPWGEYYHEAFQALLGCARASGSDRILTGIGGDEISSLQWNESAGKSETLGPKHPSFLTPMAAEAFKAAEGCLDPAPDGIAEPSFYEALLAGSTVYLRAGVWPLYPYGTPELVEFCRCLPLEWRKDRMLQRRWLEQRGLPRHVSHPEVKESFIPVLDYAMRGSARPFVTRLFEESRLAELGLVSRDRLLASFERYCTEDEWEESSNLLEAAVLELTLRAVERARAAPTSNLLSSVRVQ